MCLRSDSPCRPLSYLGPLVFFVPDLWFPQFDFVSFGVHYPGKSPVLVEFGTLQDLNAGILELSDHFLHIVDSIINHETRFARAEPFRARLCDMPCRNTFILRFVLGPLNAAASQILTLRADMLLVP